MSLVSKIIIVVALIVIVVMVGINLINNTKDINLINNTNIPKIEQSRPHVNVNIGPPMTQRELKDALEVINEGPGSAYDPIAPLAPFNPPEGLNNVDWGKITVVKVDYYAK